MSVASISASPRRIRDSRWPAEIRGRFKPREAAWGVCLLATVLAVFLFRLTKTSVLVAPMAAIAGGGILIPACLHVIYTRWRPDPLIGPIAGGLAVITWAGLVSGMTALAALRTGAPLVDPSLARTDAIIGLHTPTLVIWVAHHTVIAALLSVAYKSTVPLVFATVMLLGLTRHDHQMWELCFLFAATGPVCASINAAAPAIAAFTYYGIQPDSLALLPTGAGRFHLPIFVAYHSRILNAVDVRQLEGVVTFPSFHTIMALTTAYALRNHGALSALAWAWCSLTLVSTIPIGGHYATDVIGGAAVWAIFTTAIQGRTFLHRLPKSQFFPGAIFGHG